MVHSKLLSFGLIGILTLSCSHNTLRDVASEKYDGNETGNPVTSKYYLDIRAEAKGARMTVQVNEGAFSEMVSRACSREIKPGDTEYITTAKRSLSPLKNDPVEDLVNCMYSRIFLSHYYVGNIWADGLNLPTIVDNEKTFTDSKKKAEIIQKIRGFLSQYPNRLMVIDYSISYRDDLENRIDLFINPTDESAGVDFGYKNAIKSRKYDEWLFKSFSQLRKSPNAPEHIIKNTPEAKIANVVLNVNLEDDSNCLLDQDNTYMELAGVHYTGYREAAKNKQFCEIDFGVIFTKKDPLRFEMTYLNYQPLSIRYSPLSKNIDTAIVSRDLIKSGDAQAVYYLGVLMIWKGKAENKFYLNSYPCDVISKTDKEYRMNCQVSVLPTKIKTQW